MKTVYLNVKNLEYWKNEVIPSVMALGFFDGIHKGHQEVIRTAANISKKKNLSLAVMSFFPHPKSVLSNGKIEVNYLMSLSEKKDILQTLGVDTFYIVEFNKHFSSLSPQKFVETYILGLGVVHAVAGFDYSYGFKGQGNMDRLKKDSGGLLEVTKVEKIECHGEKISSSCIREKLREGKVKEISHLLNRPYETKCEFNGECFNLLPYYTLPSPGQYDVTIKKEDSFQYATVLVTENHDIISQTPLERLSCHQKDIVVIKWHEQKEENQFLTNQLETVSIF